MIQTASKEIYVMLRGNSPIHRLYNKEPNENWYIIWKIMHVHFMTAQKRMLWCLVMHDAVNAEDKRYKHHFGEYNNVLYLQILIP